MGDELWPELENNNTTPETQASDIVPALVAAGRTEGPGSSTEIIGGLGSVQTSTESTEEPEPDTDTVTLNIRRFRGSRIGKGEVPQEAEVLFNLLDGGATIQGLKNDAPDAWKWYVSRKWK